MAVGREISGGIGVDIGEIAAAAARDQDFLAQLIRMVERKHAAPAARGGGGAEEPGSPGPDHDYIELFHPRCLPLGLGIRKLPEKPNESNGLHFPLQESYKASDTVYGCR